MSLVDLSSAERYVQELGLPKLFDGGFNPDRLDWYTRLVVDSDLIEGGEMVVPEFVAAMVAESNLDNRTIGDSAPTPEVGVGWCQLDTGYHVPGIDEFHAIRADPLYSLEYVADPSNGLVVHGQAMTWFRQDLWHAWERIKIDPAEGWNPLEAAHHAWIRVAE